MAQQDAKKKTDRYIDVVAYFTVSCAILLMMGSCKGNMKFSGETSPFCFDSNINI